MNTCNPQAIQAIQNLCFVQGTIVGNRAQTALALYKAINFKGGYRAAYRAVKNGVRTCGLYAGPLVSGGYGINAID